MTDVVAVSEQTTQAEVADLIASFKQGGASESLTFLTAPADASFEAPAGVILNKPLVLGDDLLFVQPDGSIVGLLDGAKASYVLTVDKLNIASQDLVTVALQQSQWETVADAVAVNLVVLGGSIDAREGGSGEQDAVSVNDPLFGLPISPLLPPTDYLFPELRDREVGEGGIGLPDVDFALTGAARLFETDASLDFVLSRYFEISAGGFADGERITSITVTIPGLPLGTTATAGSFTTNGATQSFTFVGTPEEYAALSLTFPTDFSTTSRTDAPPGDLTVSVTATSSFGGEPSSASFPLTVEAEGDLDFAGTGIVRGTETDGPIVLRLADGLTPVVTDADGSESVSGVALELTGLPAGSRISTDGGATFVAVTGSYSFSGTLAEYELVQLELPADFSTTNPVSEVRGTLTATTDEGALETRPFTVEIEATPDIVITPPAPIFVTEDGNGADGSGVTVDLDLDIFVEDVDGSEDDTRVTIDFSGLPPGMIFSTGTFNAGPSRWTGTMAEANALLLTFPGDFSGNVTSVITATNLEGSLTATQEITITPAGDVDITVSELLAAETDAVIVVNPAASWSIAISDSDPSAPFEVLETVTLTLDDLPAGVLVQNVPAATVSYDVALGGSFTFTGTGAQYALLRLGFPQDYSTESPALPGGVLTGTISASSNEGSAGPVPVTLRITPEGDALIDVLPFADLTETETPQSFRLGQVLDPRAIDIDGSEEIATLQLVVAGLPGGAGFDLSNISGLPAGATLVTAADGTQTLTATFVSSDGDVRAAFNAVTVTLPGDFSTANRADLTAGRSLPIAVNATILTDEDRDAGVDTANDGQATASAFVNVGFLDDIELTVPIEINAEEDGGVINSAAGVRVPLQIAIAITDDDGSETEATGSPFSAEVTIDFTDLPAGATLTTGVLTGTVWTGSVADARALAIDFPGNYAGIVLANITVTTLEGSRSAPQAIVVTPTPDVNITGTITATETDAPVTVLLSDFISLTITDPSEELRTLSFDLPGLPAGTLALDASGAPIGTLTPGAGGTLTFAFSYNALTDLTVDPNQIRLVFPTDFSTTSPANLLQATLTVVSVQSPFPPNPPVFATIDVEIDFEGDVRIDVVGTATLQETDAVVDFAPSDYLTPVPTDIDGSETIDQVNVTFNALPAGTLFSTDGVSFSAASAALNFVGTLAEYNALIIRLPADFATENPASTLVGTVIATTNELGVATETFAVTVSAEGDVTASGPRTLSLGENDAPGSVDLDATTQAPLQFFLASAVTAVASDADGSDEIVSVAVAMTGLPAGSRISFDNGVSFVAVDGATFPLTVPSLSAYERIVLRLPDDFSTTSPASTIAGTVTFTTNEALLNGETAATPNGGITTEGFTVTVTAEGDVSITGLSPVVIEDLGAPIDLGLAVAVTDTDGSESISTISVTFAGLPGSGPTILSDGTVLTPSANVWTGSSAAIANLAIASFPQHFSGIVTMTTTVVTNETLPGGESAVFVLSVTPVAEPDITLSVVPNAPTVTQTGPGIFAVKEDNSFLLQIDATTPDKDGSESLRTISIANMPSGWLRAGDGAVPLSRFETGSADIASATVTGTTLTITLQPGVTDFNATLRAIPAANSDLDVSTLTGGDLRATVTSVDTATGLASNTQTAQATVDVNYDAVLDPLTFATTNRAANENLTGRRGLDAGITSFALRDTDGSESLDFVTLRITVDTKSTDFDPANDSDLRLAFGSRASFVSVTKIDTVADDNIVDFVISRPAGVSDANFASALVQMQVSFPQRYSGVATLDGVVNWSETRTGDVETDLGDNNGSRPFTTVLTVRPISEATLDAGLFVTDGNFVVAGSPTQATAVANATTGNVSTSNSTPINLLESTADSTGPGQVQTFLRLNASTPDADGSENLSTLVISNIPTSWIGIAETNGNVTLTQSHFFSLSGGGPISAAEFAKVSSAVYNAATGQLTITFVTPPAGAPGITSFAGSVALYPALYEDYDVDRGNTDPFSADGNFFGADLGFRLTTSDGNTVTTGTRQANVTVNVDVKPVNNEGKVIAFPIGNEQVVDDAGGVLQFGFVPFIDDMDGSETIISTVLRNIPSGITVYVPSLSDPAGPKVPALLTSLNGDGTNDWSLEGGQWLNVEFRGVPLHFAGSIPIIVDIVTREADGGGTGKTSLMNVNIEVDPVVDGGDPSESAATVEDTAVRVVLDGNIIDNATNSPLSPEVILDPFTITNVRADSFGRLPRFFDGPPNQIGTDSAGNPIYSNEILPLFDGSYVVTPAQAADFHVLPGKDSNSSGLSGVADIQFDVRVIYRELLDVSASTPLDRFKVGTGTVRIDITGIADKPVVDGQDPDPAATAGGIDKTLINAVYRPGDTTDGVPNEDAAYAYAGFDNAPFQFLQRLSDTALQSGFAGDPAPFVAADPLSGSRTEITFAGGLPDGSETIYYVISNIPAGLRFIGGNPVDPSAGSYLVAGSKLASLGIVPQGVSDVTYYNMTLNAIVVEDDADLSGVPTAGGSVSVQDVLDAIDALPGGSVTPFDLSVVVLPSGTVGPPMSCMPGDPEYLPLPELRLVGNAFEDQPNELKIQLVPDAPVGGNPNYWNSIGDLTTLPNGVSGDFGLGIKIPPGATLSANPPGAVLFDPVTGTYSIDFSLLGVDPSDPTLTAGAIIYTPPPQQSSPVNPFPAGETLGSADPYDNLPDIEFTSLLNNYTCNLFFNQTTIVPVFVQPVVDGPTIDIGATGPFLEDTLLTPDIRISSVDGGERLTGDVVLTISGDPTASLLLSGVPLSPDAGTTARYTLTATDLPGLQVLPTRDYSGPLTLTVTASTEDIDGAIAAGTASRTFAIEAVAEVPDFVYSTDTTPTETGLPLVQDPTGPLPIVTLIEDRPALLSSFFNFGDSLDRDGSEAESAVVGPLPDYLELTGATRGIIDNGDGTFTVSRADFGTVMIGLKDAHARTPDSLDPTILAEVSINVRVNTLELSNSDEATASTQFLLRVFPDADKPTVTASISPLAGTEDDGTIYTLTVSGNTIDPHERIDFEATLPPGSRFFIGGVEQVVGADGKVAIPGAAAGIAAPGSNVFFPIGALTFIPPGDFSGLAAVDVVAITSDTSAAYGFTDTARSDPATTSVTIAAAPDLAVTVTDPTMTIAETDAPVAFMPASNVTLAVSDADGSEIVEIVTFTMTGVPDGTTVDTGSGAVPTSGTLSFTGTLAEFNALTITFPRDFATNATPLAATVQATTNEGGNQSGSFTLAIDGELDLDLSTASVRLAGAAPADLVVPLGITADVTDVQASPSETLESVVVAFGTALPAGVTASAGVIASDRLSLSLTRGAMLPADFALMVAALSLTVPAAAAATTVFDGTVTATTNHGTSAPVALDIAVNAPPVVTAPVDVPQTFDTTLSLSFADLLVNASDSDLPLTVENVTASDPLVGVSVSGTDVTLTVPAGYVGTPTLSYDVVDGGAVPARTVATAELDFDTLQMQDSGIDVTGPDSLSRNLLTDVSGDASLGGTIATGTAGNDAVIWDAVDRPYAGITEFRMLDGDDFVDLTGAPGGFRVELGAGADIVIGSGGNDVLIGGSGADSLTGGAGADTFVLASGPIDIADVITDFGAGDQIDLRSALNGIDDITGLASFNAATGALDVGGLTAFNVAAAGGGIPAQVQVIFEDSAGAAQTAVL